MNALVSAAVSGDIDCMITLLDSGFDINSRDETGRNAAIVNHRFDALKLLVERGADVTVQGDTNIQNSFLLHAVRKGPTVEQMVVLLLDAGAPIHIPSAGRMIWLVQITESIAVLDRLLARGLDISTLRSFGNRTLCHLITTNLCHKVESTPKNLSLLIAAVERAKVDVNAKDYIGFTALHTAAYYFKLDIIRLLVEMGADIDAVVVDHNTALHAAFCRRCFPKNYDTAELLLSFGASVHIVETNYHATACHGAAQLADYNAVCALIAAGSNLDQPDAVGNTPRGLLLQRNVRLPSDADIDTARRRIAKKRLDLVRYRAFTICVALQSFNLPALQMCEILMHSSTFSSLIEFHQWWAIVTAVKHFLH